MWCQLVSFCQNKGGRRISTLKLNFETATDLATFNSIEIGATRNFFCTFYEVFLRLLYKYLNGRHYESCMYVHSAAMPYRSSQHCITSIEQQEIYGTSVDNQCGVSSFPLAIVIFVINWLGLIEIIFLFCRSLRWSLRPSNFKLQWWESSPHKSM